MQSPHHALTFVLQGARTVDATEPDDKTRVGVSRERAHVQAVQHAIAGLVQAARTAPGLHYAVVGSRGVPLVIGTMPDESVATTVIGRHSHADSRAADDTLGLRHLLLVRRADSPGQLLLVDLLSEGGTATLDGTLLGSVVVSLPAVVRVGANLLVLLPSADAAQSATTLFERAVSAAVARHWAHPQTPRFIVTLDDLSPADDGALRFVPSQTQNFAPPPPQVTRQVMLRPSVDELSRGVIIGRYGRCAAPGDGLWDGMLSRVHALLFAMGDGVYVADLSSTHGVVHETLGPLRLKHLQAGDAFMLGRTRLQVEAGV